MILSDDDARISADLFGRIRDEAAFCRFVRAQFRREARGARLTPLFLRRRLLDVHRVWLRDMERIAPTIGEDGGSPDHFKRCGFLAYWLRRYAVVSDFYQTPGKDIGLRGAEEKFREVLFKYANEYFAFSLGLRICFSFEKNKDGGAGLDLAGIPPDDEYFDTVLYFLKEKHVSPHSLVLVYKSYFTGAAAGALLARR